MVEANGKRHLLEHKTTSEEISEPDAIYWQRLAIDAQVSSYCLAHWQMQERLAGTVYDVIRKPTIRPKRIPKGSTKRTQVENIGTQLEIEQCGTYFGQTVPGDIPEVETAMHYCHRLTFDCVRDPNKYFQRREIPRLDDEILEYAEELWQVARDVREARNDNRWYRNSNSCVQYGTPCQFLGICSGYDTPASDRWRKREMPHGELDESMGTDVLTHSSMKTFQSCRRKYFYRYELGLERNSLRYPFSRTDRANLCSFVRVSHVPFDAWAGATSAPNNRLIRARSARR